MTTYLTLGGAVRPETDATAIANLKRKGWTEVPFPSFDPLTETVAWNGSSFIKAGLDPSQAATVTFAQGYSVTPEGWSIRMDSVSRARWMELRDDLREQIQAGRATGQSTVTIRDVNGVSRTVTIVRLRAILLDAWAWLAALRRSNPDL